jgi:L-ascorbate metabolism protein UlaG (beta-lactamase superfamily)
VRVKWLGHASFLITSETGIRIITDPYEAGAFGGALSYGPIREDAQVVVISHDHADHNHLAGIGGQPKVVKGSGTHHAAGIDFKGVPTFHDPSGGKERGTNTIFTFSVDGIRLCHAGDLGHLPSDQELAELGSLDLFLVPVGGFYTIDAAEATRLTEMLKPRVLIPMHFRTDKCSFPIAGAEDFLAGKERVRRVGASEVELRKESLPAPTEIIVLEHAL